MDNKLPRTLNLEGKGSRSSMGAQNKDGENKMTNGRKDVQFLYNFPIWDQIL